MTEVEIVDNENNVDVELENNLTEEQENVEMDNENPAPEPTEATMEEIEQVYAESDLKVEVVEDKPKHYNDDVYRDCMCDDNELRYQMIKRPVEADISAHLFNYCDENLEQRYRHVIQENKILPMETMKKHISLKLKKYDDKMRNQIKQTIHDTFETYYPEKILTFIDSTVTLLFIERIKNMEREFACVHNGQYYHLLMKSQYNKKRLGRSFHIVDIDIVTSKFE